MKKSSLIGHTVEGYDLILHSEHPADSVLDTFFRSHKYLGSHDRRFIAETVYGMLRHKLRVEWSLHRAEKKIAGPQNQENNKSLLQCLVYLAIFGSEDTEKLVDEMDAEPEEKSFLRTVLHDAVNRNSALNLHKGSDLDLKSRLSIEFSFPEWMIESWLDRYGEEETAKLCASLNAPAPLTIRVNTLKTTLEDCRQALFAEKIESEPAQFSPSGLNLRRRMNVFGLDIFQKGFFEVQDEGSQLVALLVDPKPTSKVVDACAGGGGKSLALGALMKNRGSIYALDTNAYRLDGLRKRIRRSGVDTIRVRTVQEHQLPDDLVGTADNVLVDAPCSGLGTIRRNPGMKWSVTPESIAELNVKQASILEDYARCVKPLGRLVYATCTTLNSENEDIVEKFLAIHPEFETIEPAVILQRYGLASLGKEKYFRLLPHHHGTDGFFAAVMRRKQ